MEPAAQPCGHQATKHGERFIEANRCERAYSALAATLISGQVAVADGCVENSTVCLTTKLACGSMCRHWNKS